MREAPLPPALLGAISKAWDELSRDAGPDVAVAVRSSATAEDLPDASFAGQQETYLNVRGLDAVIKAVRDVYASLYNDRAIAYRVHKGFDHAAVALSVGVQHMVRSDAGSSGVMFTLDTESGFPDVVFITASYGLGETVVQGAVNPDEFYVYKPALRAGRRSVIRKKLGSKAIKMVYATDGAAGPRVATVNVEPADSRRYSISDSDVETLARYALLVEEHYGRPMDIEWGKDGITGEIYLLQARPETVQSRKGQTIQRYKLRKRSAVISRGPKHRPPDRGRSCPGHPRRRGHAPDSARRRARRRHDRSGLGARHEAGRGRRDQPGRPHLPRRHHRPRAGHPGRGRLRKRHRADQRRRPGHGFLRRGRRRIRLRRRPAVRRAAHRTRQPAAGRR